MGDYCPIGPLNLHTWIPNDIPLILKDESVEICLWCGIEFKDAFPSQDIEGD